MRTPFPTRFCFLVSGIARLHTLLVIMSLLIHSFSLQHSLAGGPDVAAGLYEDQSSRTNEPASPFDPMGDPPSSQVQIRPRTHLNHRLFSMFDGDTLRPAGPFKDLRTAWSEKDPLDSFRNTTLSPTRTWIPRGRYRYTLFCLSSPQSPRYIACTCLRSPPG